MPLDRTLGGRAPPACDDDRGPMSAIPPVPEKPPAKGPLDPRYQDPRDLEQELRRVFEICHNCRMCVGYCGAFPELFARVDRDIDRGCLGAEALTAEDFAAVGDRCWQCKVCYIKCPYTEDEDHAWLVDVPRQLQRLTVQRAERDGIKLADLALGEPGIVGQLSAGPMSGLTTLVHESRLLRRVMEKATGISASFALPPPAKTTFAKWLDAHTPKKAKTKRGTVSLFATCLGDYNFPNVPRAATLVLERHGFRVERPDQVCCGMPNLDGGDIQAATRKAELNVASLARALDAGHRIVSLQPTCTLTLKHETVELLGTSEARRVADAIVDVMQLFDELRRSGDLDTSFEKSLGTIAYHAPCHLRSLKIGYPAVRVLQKIPDTSVETIAECSAVDGTWGMKAEHFAEGQRYAKKLIRGIDGANAKFVSSDCKLAGRRILMETGKAPLHPIELLAKAYGLTSSD